MSNASRISLIVLAFVAAFLAVPWVVELMRLYFDWVYAVLH